MIGQLTRRLWDRLVDIRVLGTAVTCAVLLPSGCQFGRPAPYETDPLLRSRKPSRILGHRVEEFARLPLQEPLVPNPPPMSVNAGPHLGHVSTTMPTSPPGSSTEPDESEELPIPRPTQDESDVNRDAEIFSPPMFVPEVTESTSFKGPEPKLDHGPELTAPRQVPGNFGKAGDHQWLQGVVDRHYRGHVSLRYQRPSEDDVWGGKVNLIGEEFLKGFESGDVIYVEGELRPDEAPPEMDGRTDYPGYRIRGAWLIKRRP